MATKVPSSVLHRESPAKGFAIKPRRFSKLYGICKRGIIYFYFTEKNELWINLSYESFAMRFALDRTIS